jgi:ProQ/FINO family
LCSPPGTLRTLKGYPMTDLSKTSGASPPTAVIVSPETLTAYRIAVKMYRGIHGPKPGKEWPAEREAYLARLAKVRADVLGDAYIPGCYLLDHDPCKEPAFAPTPVSPELAALRRKVRGVQKWLLRTFPDCFFKDGAEKPLKRGIITDILERYQMTPEETYLLREAVGAYRLSHGYRKAYVLGAERVNLGGKVVAIVGDDGPDCLNDRLRADLAAQASTMETASC